MNRQQISWNHLSDDIVSIGHVHTSWKDTKLLDSQPLAFYWSVSTSPSNINFISQSPWKEGLGKKQFDPKVRCSSAHKCRLEIAASAVALWFLEHCQHSPWLLRSLDDYVLQLPFDTWEGKLYHVEFALKAKLKSQTACVIILSHHITMKCHGPIHYTDSESASRSFIFSWPRLSSLPDTICILPCIYVGQVKSL